MPVQLLNFSGSKIRYLCVHTLTLFISLRVVDLYGETCLHSKFRVGEHSGTSPLTSTQSKLIKSTAVRDHVRCTMCNHVVTITQCDHNFKVLASSNSEFHLKIEESVLISREQFILSKNEASLSLYLFD